MKLTNHQKEIIIEIINGKVFDITSYLITFQNYILEKYDIDELRKKFNEEESGKEYKVIKEGFSLFTFQRVEGIVPMTLPTPRLSIPESEYELKKAKFIEKTPKIKYEYEDNKYEYDFSKGVKVVKDFNDLIDFLSLWHYLKQECLILELDRKINKDDIGVFFEPVPNNEKTIDKKITIKYGGKEIEPLVKHHDVLEKAPSRFAHKYSDTTWVINEERLFMCHDFLDKKIVPTTALRTYAQKKFRTKEKRSQQINLFIAICALVISFVSVVLGNIIPLFKTKNTEKYLMEINEQVKNIEIILEEEKELSSSELHNLKKIILEIEEKLSNLSNENNQSIEDIKQELLSIKESLLSITSNENT